MSLVARSVLLIPLLAFSRGWLRFLVLLAAVSGAGCAGDLDEASEVHDLRILAVRAEPPELLFDRDAEGKLVPAVADGADPALAGQVRFEVLAADPAGGELRFSWRLCPLESESGCEDFAAQRAALPEAARPVLDAAYAQTLLGTAAAPALTGTDSYEVPPFAAQVGGDLATFHLLSSGFGQGNGAWPSAVVEVASGAQTVRAQKRVVLNARDPRAFAGELKTLLGVDVCPGDAAPGAACLPMGVRTANRNPTIASLLVAPGERADTPFAPLPDPGTGAEPELVVRAGASVRVLPVMDAAAEETFQIVDSSFQDNHLYVDTRREQLVVSWFATVGQLADTQTAALLTKTFDNTFTAPETVPAAGLSGAIWMVVRDQRGGVGWRKLLVRVTS